MATFSISKKTLSLPPEMLKKQAKVKAFLINSSSAIITLISLMTIVCFMYLAEFNNIATQGVIINDLERNRSKLIIENEVWNMRIAQLKSMDVIEHQDVVKKMPDITPSEINFIDLDRKKGDKPDVAVPLPLPEATPPQPIIDKNIE